MALELKSGQMLHYKRRIFGRNWREMYVVLYNDSTLAWYKDKGLTEQESGLIIKDAPELLAYGQFTNMIPNRPDLPENYSPSQLLAFGARGKETVHWFLCPTEQEVESWMTAISNTLPPPPQPPQPPQPPPQEQEPPETQASAPETDFLPVNNNLMPQPLQAPLPLQAFPPPYQPHPPQVGIPGQYPTPTGFRAPYTASPLQPAYPYSIQARGQPTPANGNTTVVVQDRRNDGGGDFAMGMLMGGAIGTTMGYSWGHGLGWGHGWGGHGYYSGGTNIHDTDVTVNNYYDYDNTVVNNDIDINTSRDMTVADDVIASDFGGDMGGDFGGDMGGDDFDIGDMGGF